MFTEAHSVKTDNTSAQYVGGLIGLNSGNITFSSASTDIYCINYTNRNINIGGLIGRNEGNIVISNSYAVGNVYADNYVDYMGGICGYAGGINSVIQNCYAAVSLNSSAYYMSGINYYCNNIVNSYYGLDGNLVKWDAENYDQRNPLTTNEFGMYAWDVPEGFWKVKVEKEGYELTDSVDVYGWLPVPPPQMEVNLGLVSKDAPTVTSVNGSAGI